MFKICTQLKVGVCGLGVVGSAILESLESRLSHAIFNRGYCKLVHETSRIEQNDVYHLPHHYSFDLYKNINTFASMLSADILFLCLPTEISSETNTYNLDAIISTLDELHKNNYRGLVVLKSTVVPGTCEHLCKRFLNLEIVYNPEFLSAKSAVFDFEHQKHIIIGGSNENAKEKLKKFFIRFQYSLEDNISLCSFEEAECAKIFCNSFYACKVQIFTEFYKVCERLQLRFETVRDMMLKNEWIHPMHTSVPGPDGKISFGGMCLPKDSQALITLMKHLDVPCKVLESVLKERNEMR